jgi:hypothetical protein
MKKPFLTARELLALLTALPEADLDLPLYTEGCDCVGPCGGIDAANDAGERAIILTRDEERGRPSFPSPQQ